MDKIKVLVVDDESRMRKLVHDFLSRSNYEVIEAADGEEAIDIFYADKSISLIILDVMMPNMNGWETLKSIRSNEDTKHLPVIMLTAVNEEQKMVSGLKIGADDYIVKPFILPNLLARIEAVLRRSSWQKESSKPLEKANLEVLTSREKDVLQMAAKGASNKEIAEKLVVKEVTVKTHINSIFKKLKVANRTQAVLLAMQADLINN